MIKFIICGLIAPLIPLIAFAENIHDHSHFDSERIKNGVIFHRSWRSQAEIDSDWWTYKRTIPAGAPNSAWYDKKLDGALLPIRNIRGKDITLGALGKKGHFEVFSSSNTIWIQYEQYMQQAFYDNILSQANFDSMKLTRIKMPKRICKERPSETRLLTTTWLGSKGNSVEVAVSSGCFGFPSQGINTNYVLEGDSWTRVTIQLDIAGDKIKIWFTNISTGSTTEVFSMKVQFPPSVSINAFRAQLQSTSRNHKPGSTPYNYFVGYRNLIISTDKINF